MAHGAHDAAPPPPPTPGPAAPGAPAATLQPDALDAPAPAAAVEAARASELIEATSGHQHGGSYVHTDAGRGPEAAAHGHHGSGGEEGGEDATPYVCPLHPSIQHTEPGSCPICGTTLERRGDGG